MAPRLKWRIEGTDQMEAKFRDPSLLAVPLQAMLTEATKIGLRAAVDSVDGGRGIAGRSMMAYVNPASAKVVTMIKGPRFTSIDKGRRAGSLPNSGSIARWADAVGARGQAEVIMHEIKRRGVTARNVTAMTVSAVKDGLPRLLDQMRAAIVRRWESR